MIITSRRQQHALQLAQETSTATSLEVLCEVERLVTGIFMAQPFNQLSIIPEIRCRDAFILPSDDSSTPVHT